MIGDYLLILIALFGISAIAVYFLSKVGVPAVVGFLLGGLIIGPAGLNVVSDRQQIEILAEIGVILLMFTIGLEFSLKNLVRLRSLVFGGGFLQVCFAALATMVLSFLLLGASPNEAVFNGILVSLSSTAIVFKMILDRAEVYTPYGRAVVGMLIFQDLCVVLYVLLVPVLAGRGGDAGAIILTVLKAVAVIGGVLFGTKYAVPWILREIVKTRSRELFIITVVVLCVGTALLTSMLGLSLALGAFLAGVVISESEYSAQTVADILPLKESFSALFFISIGMLLNLDFLFANAGMTVAVVTVIILVKVITAAVAAYLTGQSPLNALKSGLYLAQIGEFSFVIVVAGGEAGLIGSNSYQLFLAASVLTMILTPFLIAFSAPVASWLVSFAPLRGLEVMQRRREREHYPTQLKDHVVIVGAGVNGTNLARALHCSNLPYAILDLDSVKVRKLKREGQPVYYGDGTNPAILRKLGLQSARVLVVAISDAAATRKVVKSARTETPYLFIVARTRYVSEVDDLIKVGADEVIPEEFETSVEIFSKVLHHYHVPVNVIRGYVEETRADNYLVLRRIRFPRKALEGAYDFVQGIDMETYRVEAASCLIGYTLADLNLRSRMGVTVIGVRRGSQIHELPAPDFSLSEGDILVLIGSKESIENAAQSLETGTCLEGEKTRKETKIE